MSNEEALMDIAYALNGIDLEDMTAAEWQICEVLVQIGLLEKMEQELGGDVYYEYWIVEK